MLQFPRWRVDVTVGDDLVKTTYETATTPAAAVAKAKQKLRGAVSSAGRFKFKATKVAGEPKRHHAKKKSAAQLDREIAEALAQAPEAKDFRVVVFGEPGRAPIHVSPWMTLAQAHHAQRNHRAMNKARGHEDYEVVIEPRWMVEEREQKSRSHATKKAASVSVGDEVYAVSGGRRHGPGTVEEIYDDGSMRVDFTRQFGGRLRVRPEDLIPTTKRSHATKTTVPYEGMRVRVTKVGAKRHGVRPGLHGTIERVSSPDVRRGAPTSKARVLVSVHGAEFSTDWPTDALRVA